MHRVAIFLGPSRFARLKAIAEKRHIRRLGELARILLEEGMDAVEEEEDGGA